MNKDPLGSIRCEDAPLTKQEFAESCDINHIMARALKTGMLPVSQLMPSYADLASMPDFQTAMNTIARGTQLFDALPSHLRERFNNQPGQLLNFLSDKGNREEAIKLGLIEPQEAAPGPLPAPSNQGGKGDASASPQPTAEGGKPSA